MRTTNHITIHRICKVFQETTISSNYEPFLNSFKSQVQFLTLSSTFIFESYTYEILTKLAHKKSPMKITGPL